MIYLKDAYGAPLTNVEVLAAGETYRSDARGILMLYDLPMGNIKMKLLSDYETTDAKKPFCCRSQKTVINMKVFLFCKKSLLLCRIRLFRQKKAERTVHMKNPSLSIIRQERAIRSP